MGRLPLGSLARHTRGRPLARPANGDARFDRRSAVLRRDVSDARAERRNILETVGEMTRASEGGRFATESPGLHSVAGRMGLGWKPPPCQSASKSDPPYCRICKCYRTGSEGTLSFGVKACSRIGP